MSVPEIVSYSEIETYRQCALKHQLSYVERWRPDGTEAEALARGTLFHSVMEAHYGKIRQIREESPIGSHMRVDNPWAEDLFLAVAPLLYEEGTGFQTERQELVEWMYRGYVDLYGTDKDWEVVGIEVPFQTPMVDYDGNPSDIHLKGTADLIVKDHSAGGGLWIVDHKTCKNLPKQKDFDMEDQTAIYTYLMKYGLGWDIRGAIYNHVRTWKLQRDMEPEERFKRTLTVRSNRELLTMVAEAEEQMQQAYRGPAAIRSIALDKGSVEPSAAPMDAPRTPDGERCGWKCGYTEACLAGRKMGPTRTRQFLGDIGFSRHDTKPGPTFNKDREVQSS